MNASRYFLIHSSLWLAVIATLTLPSICLNTLSAAPEKSAAPASPADAEFFESRIRPLLVENCFECHGAEKQKGGLRLDSPRATLKGGDSGPAIVPGDPGASLLVQAVHWGAGDYAGDYPGVTATKKDAGPAKKSSADFEALEAPTG